MTSYELSDITSSITVVVGLTGLVRFRRILPRDRPLVYICMIGAVNIILCYFVAKITHNTYPYNNSYQLLDLLFFSTLFYNWGCLYPRKWALRLLQILCVTVWIIDIRSGAGFYNQNTLFPVLFAFTETLMAIDRINSFILRDRGNLLRNGRFLCALSVIIFNSYFVILAVFWWINPPLSEVLYDKIILFWELANLLAGTILLAAVFCLPVREKFVLPLSKAPANPDAPVAG